MLPNKPPVDAAPPLQIVLELADLRKPLDFTELFGRDAPVEIEVGIGSGYFLSRYGQDHRELNLLGLDKAGSEVRRTQDKCRRLGVSNVRLLRCDAIYFLEDYPPDGSVDAFHVYYSDPWPKTRHHKRRLWRPEFVRQIERVLRPGGLLRLKTDVTEYFGIIRGLLDASPSLALREERRLDIEPMAGDYQTNFQRKAVEAGHPLHFQVWERLG